MSKRYRSALNYGGTGPEGRTLSEEIFHAVGTEEREFAKPTTMGDLTLLHLIVEGGGAFRLRPGAYQARTFTADATANTLTITAHGLATGDGPYKVSTTTTLPAPLTTTTLYWLIRVDANTLQLATSWENAMAGTAIDLTSTGIGTQTLGGMPGAPGAAVTDGYGSVLVAGGPHTYAAPDVFTVRGVGALDVLALWWT